MVLSHNGHVQSYGCHLSYTDRARGALELAGGTRHTSAKCFSYDEPGTLVITVSEDGPVTVFAHGAKLVRLAPQSTDPEADLPNKQTPNTDD
jgi:DNA integrity scanning protein DisA with diadenylate cyclase activity